VRAAGGDANVVEALTEVPEADLVEVVEADGAGNGVDEHGVWYGAGDDVGEADLEEVDATEDGARIEVADADED